MLLEMLTRIVASLTDALSVEREPRTALLNDPRIHTHVEHLTRTAHALSVQDVELDLAERRSELVLHHLHASAVADHRRILAIGPRLLDRTDAPHVQAHGGIEFQGISAGRGLRAPEHHAD